MINNIEGRNESATIMADFDTIRTLLQTNKSWAADVLQKSGEYRWIANYARWYGQTPFGGSIVDPEPDSFIVWGATSQKSYLVYHVERAGEGHIRITPVEYISRQWKIFIAIGLAFIFVIPVLLSPLVWWLYKTRMLRASRVYLPSFCRYLQNPLRSDADKTNGLETGNPIG